MSEVRIVIPTPPTDDDKRRIERLFQDMHNKMVVLAATLDPYYDTGEGDEVDLPVVGVYGTGDDLENYDAVFMRITDDASKQRIIEALRAKIAETGADIAMLSLPAYFRTVPPGTSEEDMHRNRETFPKEETLMLTAETKSGAVAFSKISVTRSPTAITLGKTESVCYVADRINTKLGDFFNRFPNER